MNTRAIHLCYTLWLWLVRNSKVIQQYIKTYAHKVKSALSAAQMTPLCTYTGNTYSRYLYSTCSTTLVMCYTYLVRVASTNHVHIIATVCTLRHTHKFLTAPLSSQNSGMLCLTVAEYEVLLSYSSWIWSVVIIRSHLSVPILLRINMMILQQQVDLGLHNSTVASDSMILARVHLAEVNDWDRCIR
jgi:hypothetical protein